MGLQQLDKDELGCGDMTGYRRKCQLSSNRAERTCPNSASRCWMGRRLEPLVNEEDMQSQNWLPAWLEESQQFPKDKGLEDEN
eukprot:5417445-Pleurochrysis_carterae.AAC.1